MKQFNAHTLDDGWMLDVASGVAPRAMRVLAACQSALRADVYARYSAAETAFGALFESAPVAAVSSGALDAVMARIDEAPNAPFANAAAHDPVIPAALKCEIHRSVHKSWRRRIGGHSEIVLDSLCEEGVKARLLSIPPGKGAPEHGHAGEEITLVLSGSFNDGQARFERGDTCHAGPDLVHTPRVDSEETCICFAVELGDLKPTNPALSWANRVFGPIM
ncbi:cupin domain-containing protein [Maricaulaceae bacterium NA33B04]|nr:cupin domain-containing protein [Maricaulaceae bacterium NA33B04]